MHIIKSGKGIPILFLHGFCEDHRVWGHLCAQLDSRFLCIRPDLPGFGKSKFASSPDLKEWAKELASSLDDEPVHLIGHSMGGYLSLAFAELYPERVSSLSLFHSSCLADNEEKKEARSKQVKFVENYGVAKYVDQLIPGLFASNTGKSIIEKQLEQAREQSATGIQEALKAMREREDRSHILQDATFPVHILSGKHDSLLSLKQQATMVSLPNRVKWTVLNQSGHMGLLEEVDIASKEITEFIGNL